MLRLTNFSRLNGSMFFTFSSSRRSRLVLIFAVLAAAFLAAFEPVLAQGTHLWTQSRLEEFEKGSPQGVALASDGQLREGPGVTEKLTSPSTYVWSVAVDSSGTAYLGTASPATVLRVGVDGKAFTLFETKDLSVQVVRLGPDGALYAATMPSGKVFRLNPGASVKQDESNATVVFNAAHFDVANASGSSDKDEKKAHYIWDLTFDAAGRLYIAAGGPAAIYRVDVAQKSEGSAFFKCDEQHLRSLAWDAKGNLIAGSDGSGLVYRITPQGKGYVLFEAPRREITAVAVSANGTIYAASVGDKSHNPLPQLPVQGTGSATFTVVQPGSMQTANASASLPEGSEIYALNPAAGDKDQAPRKLWSGKDEIVYALAARADGLLALTGNRGRIFRINDDGSYADIAHLDAQQGLSLAVAPGADDILVGTGNTGKLISLGRAEKHEYASDVLDAGALARFGRIEIQPGSANFELLTRTGNVEQPARGRNDWGWSDWQPLRAGAVASPAGRYLQWKAVLRAHGTLAGVGVNYLPVNAAPVVDDVAVAPGARYSAQGVASQPATVSIAFASASQNAVVDGGSSASPLQAAKDRTAITVRWAAHDDNGDDLSFSLYLRGDGESVWRLLKDNLTDKAYSFDAALIPDGGYQIKVVATDAPSHTPGDALSGDKLSEHFEVDTTPPVVSNLKVSLAVSAHVTFDAEDAASTIARTEYSLDAGPWQYIEPVGGLSDAKREHYDLLIPVTAKAAEHIITVRVYDRHDNVGVAKTIFGAEQK